MTHSLASLSSGEQFQARFVSSLNRPIVDKCNEWTSLIQEMLNINTKVS